MQRWLFLAATAVIFAVMALAVIIRAISGGEEQGGGWGGGRTLVSVYTVQPDTFADVVEALGNAGANESVSLTAKVSDIIARLDFDSGARVEQGEILVELADAEEAAGLSEARATLRETQRDIARIQDLTDRGVASRTRLDEAQAALDRARARVEAIEARMADRIIRAPFSGVIGLRTVSVGELVGPGDVIARLDDTSVIKLDFTVPERFLSVIDAGQVVRARSAAFPEEVFQGEVSQVDSRIDPATRTVTVRALIDNADGRLRPGMLMTVELRRDERESPAVPGSSIVRFGEQTFVYVITEGQAGPMAVRRDIELGLRNAGMVEVVNGLSLGERIVSEGVHRVREGSPLELANAPAQGGGQGLEIQTGEAARMTLTDIAVRRPVLAFRGQRPDHRVRLHGACASCPCEKCPMWTVPSSLSAPDYPGANAEVIENRVTQVIEDSLSGIEGVDTISSSSRDRSARVTITFTLERDIEAAANDVRDAVSRIRDRLPEDVQELEVAKQDSDARPFLWYMLISDRMTSEELTDYAERNIVDRFSVLDGVANVRMGGQRRYAMRIWLDPHEPWPRGRSRCPTLKRRCALKMSRRRAARWKPRHPAVRAGRAPVRRCGQPSPACRCACQKTAM
jgi:membrane fusion protein (multidrug efflux system)